MANEIPRTPTMRRQVIALLAVAALLVVLLALSIAYRHDQFTRSAEVHFITDNANNLASGTSVRLSGVRIGAVSDVAMQPDMKVRVTLSIGADSAASLRADAHAALVREQLRAPALDLFAGKSAQPLSGGRIGYSRGATLTEMADELRARVTPILDDVKQVSGMLRERQDDVRTIVENMRKASQELAGTAKEMRLLAADARGRVTAIGVQVQGSAGELNKSVLRAGALLGQVQDTLAPVSALIPELVQKTNRTLDQLQAIAADGRTVSAAAAAQVPGMLRGAAPLVDDVRDVVQGARQSWPVRSLLPAAPPAQLPIDSHDAAALHRALDEPAPN